MYKHDIKQLTSILLEQAGVRNNELWRTLVLDSGREHPHYMISNHGRVISLPRWRDTPSGPKIWKGKIISLSAQKNGQMRFGISWNGKNRLVYVHRAFMWTFVGPQAIGVYVRHLDGNPANNKLDNLAYGSPWANLADSSAYSKCNGVIVCVDLDLQKRMKDALANKDDALNVLRELCTLVSKHLSVI